MSRFEFVNPLAAGGDAVRNFLMEREKQQRQAMLDQISMENQQRLGRQTEASIANTTASTKRLEQDSEAARADRERTNNEQAAKTLSDSLSEGDVLTPGMVQTFDKVPGFEGFHKKGAPVQGAQLNPNTDEVPQYEVKQPETFAGTPKQREEHDIEAKVHALLDADPTLLKDPQVKLMYDYASITKQWGGLFSAIASMKKDPTPHSLAQQANDAHQRGDMKEYNRLLGVIKATGQADDRPFAPYVLTTPGSAPVIIDRGSGTERTVTAPGGAPAPVVNTAETANRNAGIQRAAPVLASIDELSAKINTQEGLIAKMAGSAEKAAAKLNYDDDVAEYQAVVASFTPLLARALGHVGVLTQQDVDSAKEILPKPGDSKTLRNRKMTRVRTIIGGGGQTPAPGGGSETPEQRRKRLYDKFSQPDTATK